MFSMPRIAMVLLAAALTAAAAPAFPEPPKSRDAALAALRSPDAATRAEAVNWIANRGGMPDAPLLHERLRDESLFVRGFAEQVRVRLKRLAEPGEGLLGLVEREMDLAQAGERAEVGRIALEHLGAVGDRAPEFARQVIHGGTAVPAFREVGSRFCYIGKCINCFGIPAGLKLGKRVIELILIAKDIAGT